MACDDLLITNLPVSETKPNPPGSISLDRSDGGSRAPADVPGHLTTAQMGIDA